jgi:hypothetical protein
MLESVEKVGEVVVSILGLDDSRYQDVLDGMTPREMQEAERVNAQREEEYRLLSLNQQPGLAENAQKAVNLSTELDQTVEDVTTKLSRSSEPTTTALVIIENDASMV